MAPCNAAASPCVQDRRSRDSAPRQAELCAPRECCLAQAAAAAISAAAWRRRTTPALTCSRTKNRLPNRLCSSVQKGRRSLASTLSPMKGTLRMLGELGSTWGGGCRQTRGPQACTHDRAGVQVSSNKGAQGGRGRALSPQESEHDGGTCSIPRREQRGCWHLR